MKALILAGGYGTRLRDVVSDRPKPMASVNGKPFLEYQLNALKQSGIEDVVLAVNYGANYIKSYFGNGFNFGVNIIYSDEKSPLGTAGAIKNAQMYLESNFLALNGDSYSEIDINEFARLHNENNSHYSIALKKEYDSENFGNVVLNGNKIVNFNEKSGQSTGLISRGIYLLEPEIFDIIPSGKKVSLEQEVFPKLVDDEALHGFAIDGYFQDIGRPETYDAFKRYFLGKISLPQEKTVRDAIQNIDETKSDLLLVVNDEDKLAGVVTGRNIQRFFIEGGNLEDQLSKAMIKHPRMIGHVGENEESIHEKLLGANRLPIVDEQGRVVDIRYRVEEFKEKNLPIVRGKAPLRISFAGGGTDLPYFYNDFGGIVINATIDKHCHATLVQRADRLIVINSDIESNEVVIDPKNMAYDGTFDLVKAVYKIMNPEFGFDLYSYNDIPPKRGLGGSASMAGLVASLIATAENKKIGDYELAQIALQTEREELNIPGGLQDQFASVTGGFNFMEFGHQKNIVYPLRLKPETIDDLTEHLSLFYVGNDHQSGDVHASQKQGYDKNGGKSKELLHQMKRIAIEIKDRLLTGEIEDIGNLLHESWICKRDLSEKISDPRIDELYQCGLENGSSGGKLLGAGGGGYLLFFHSPSKRNTLKRSLEDQGLEFCNFDFEFEGIKTWRTQKK